MSGAEHEVPTPDPRLLVGSVADFVDLVDWFAGPGNFASYTIPELAEGTGFSKSRLRGALTTGWAKGWFRPITSPTTGRIERWALDLHLVRYARAFDLTSRKRAEAIRRELQATYADIDRLAGGTNDPQEPA